MRRAVISIRSHIAESAARQTPKEFIQYVPVSQGLLSELDTQLEMATQLEWLQKKHGDGLLSAMNRMNKMQSGFIRHQQSSRPSLLTPHEKTNPQSIRKGVE